MRYVGIIILLLSCVAQAHIININELKGQKLCVDAESIQVNILDTNDSKDEEQTSFVYEQLSKSLRETLNTYDIPYQEKKSCSRDRAFVYVLYQSNWGEDTSGLPYMVFTASVQAGKASQPIEAHFEYLLAEQKFENYTSALLFEDELPQPIHAGLVEINQEMITELATGWWESFELEQEARRQRQPVVLRRLLALSVFATSLIIAAGLWIYNKRQEQGASGR